MHWQFRGSGPAGKGGSGGGRVNSLRFFSSIEREERGTLKFSHRNTSFQLDPIMLTRLSK